jgi:hypothetical protein
LCTSWQEVVGVFVRFRAPLHPAHDTKAQPSPSGTNNSSKPAHRTTVVVTSLSDRMPWSITKRAWWNAMHETNRRTGCRRGAAGPRVLTHHDMAENGGELPEKNCTQPDYNEQGSAFIAPIWKPRHFVFKERWKTNKGDDQRCLSTTNKEYSCLSRFSFTKGILTHEHSHDNDSQVAGDRKVTAERKSCQLGQRDATRGMASKKSGGTTPITIRSLALPGQNQG